MSHADESLAARRLLAVTEEELQRLVLDIHDGPVQDLFAALSQLSLLRTHLSTTPRDDATECAPVLDRATALIEASLRSIRDLLGIFRTPEFAEHGLTEIIEDLAVQHEAFTGDTVILDLQTSLPVIPLPIKIALCRILQEALSNVHRHAGVNAAELRLWMAKDRIGLEVKDQGRGFEPPPLDGPAATERHEHIGLRGMRERAALVNGRLVVESQPGTGTCVRVEIPLYG